MYVPNARTDEVYNEKYLAEKDKDVIAGYDEATKTIDSFFDNLEVYDFEVDEEDIDLGRFLDNHEEIKEALKNNLLEHLESGRNTLVVEMIDHMDDGEYEKIKAKVDGDKTDGQK